MKTGIYCRVSTRENQDITTQVDFLKRYAEREELDIYNIYTDIGQSGAKEKRPAFDQFLADMRAKKFQIVLVYKLDRIGRSLSHLVSMFEEYNKKNITFISATQSINTTTPEGRMFLHILMVLASYERELTISRIMDGLDRAKRQGKKLGRRPGCRDKKKRRRSGYHLRWSEKPPINSL